MLKSLFGDLGIHETRRMAQRQDFAATAVFEVNDPRLADNGRIVDRHSSDLYFTGSAAVAMREHLAQTPPAADQRVITLFDPMAMWAGSVIKALSDATGQPVERVQLRDAATLRTLAAIERTQVARRDAPSLKLYRAEIRDAPAGGESDRVAHVLMEHSHMAAAIVGALAPEAVESALRALQFAVRHPSWKCPYLLFLLPPNAAWIAQRIDQVQWPAALRVQWIDEPLTGASAVWNIVLRCWDQFSGGATAVDTRFDLAAVSRQLRGLAGDDGVLGVGLVDVETGALLAAETRRPELALAAFAPSASNSATTPELGVAAAALAHALRAQQEAAQVMGLTAPVEEVMVCAGAFQSIVRRLSRRPDLCLVALLDRQHANLALARFKLVEAQRHIG